MYFYTVVQDYRQEDTGNQLIGGQKQKFFKLRKITQTQYLKHL